MTTVLTGKEQIAGARLLTLRQGLRLECKGMTRHGRSCYALIKEEFGLHGSKESVFEQFTAILQGKGILV